MYITLDDFELNVQKYMQLAKTMDLYVVDFTQNIVWTLRRQRNSPLTQLTQTIRNAFRTGLHNQPAQSRHLLDFSRLAC